MTAEQSGQPQPPRIQFSLFEGDLLNRIFIASGLKGRRIWDLIGRMVFLILLMEPYNLVSG